MNGSPPTWMPRSGTAARNVRPRGRCRRQRKFLRELQVENRFWQDIEKCLPKSAAYLEYHEHIGNAWMQDDPHGELLNALNFAIQIGETHLLRDYVSAGKPIPQDMPINYRVRPNGSAFTQPLPTLIASLFGSEHPEIAKQGRPHRVPTAAPLPEKAERNAAWLVACELKNWRECHNRKRVPGVIKNKMIKAAIKVAAKSFDVSVDAIGERNIRNLLQNGSIRVR